RATRSAPRAVRRPAAKPADGASAPAEAADTAAATRTRATARRAAKTTQPPQGAGDPRPMSAEERHQMIARNAYFRAANRGWAPGGELDDWLAAEREVDDALR